MKDECNWILVLAVYWLCGSPFDSDVLYFIYSFQGFLIFFSEFITCLEKAIALLDVASPYKHTYFLFFFLY